MFGFGSKSIALAAFLFMSFAAKAEESAKIIPKVLAITQIVEHPTADSVRRGIEDELNGSDYKIGDQVKWVYENAQNNTGTAIQIAKKFRSLNPDIVVAITTPSAQTIVNEFKGTNTPIVFSSVTDPIVARLVEDMDKPGGNITGTTDLPPVKAQIELIQKIVPNVKKIGVLSNPGEPNSTSLFKHIQACGAELSAEIIMAPVLKSSELLTATKNLIGKVDAIYVPLDNTILQGIESVLKVGMDHKIPVFSADRDSVKKGVVAARGYDHYDIGRATGKMIIRILEGAKPSELAVATADQDGIYLNVVAAGRMGVTIGDDLIQNAKMVIRE